MKSNKRSLLSTPTHSDSETTTPALFKGLGSSPAITVRQQRQAAFHLRNAIRGLETAGRCIELAFRDWTPEAYLAVSPERLVSDILEEIRRQTDRARVVLYHTSPD